MRAGWIVASFDQERLASPCEMSAIRECSTVAIGDIKTFTINQGGLSLEIDAIDMGDGTTQFVVRCLEGSGDINALYWGDGDGDKKDGTYFNSDGTAATDPFPASLNMNGTKAVFDSGIMLSAPGLGPEGTDKPSFITAGETLNAFTLNVDWASIDDLGVRATSVNGNGSIKGVDTEADVTAAPDISVDDAACVIEGGTATFTINLSHAYDYDITINYETASGTATEGDDYTGKTGSVTIKAGETSATVEIETIDDDEIEGEENEHFTLKLTSAQVNLDDDDDIELNLTANITDAEGEGCIEDNDEDNGGGGGGPGDPNHFPEWGAPSISHVTFYFNTGTDPYYSGDTSGLLDTTPPIDKSVNDPDGWFTVKFDVDSDVSNDLDDWYGSARSRSGHARRRIHQRRHD